MQQITLDFETYYDTEYSLRKMTPVEYILDPRFEIIGCAVKEGDDKSFWLEERELGRYLRGLPQKVAAISHNAPFDMGICAWRMDWLPTLMIDTLGMSRAWLQAQTRSLSLDNVAKLLGLGVKGGTVHQVKGMRVAAIKAAGLYEAYADYSCGDADLSWGIFITLMKQGFPASELMVMDTVLRACVQPRFVLDSALLAEHLQKVQTDKLVLLAQTGFQDRDVLMSNDRFAEALRNLGVEPPTKISLTTGKETLAFAKTDQEFLDLEEHENPMVQALVAARLGIKSTIEETRTQRLMAIEHLTWPGKGQARLLPMPLKFSGAHTHRLSGDWKMNMQNLPSRGENKLKKAIRAIVGEKVVQADASQIEARLVCWFSGASNMVEQFANKEDVYSTFASTVFGYPVGKKTHPKERFIGKTAVLGLGYNMGWLKFQGSIAVASRSQLGELLELSDEEATRVVNTYRRVYAKIPAMWKFLENMLSRMTDRDLDEPFYVDGIEVIRFQFEKIRLPNGLFLYYKDLQYRNDQWRFTYGGMWKTIYGGKLLENIIQALSRICTMDAAVRIRKRLDKAGIYMNLQVHDALVYVTPDKFVAVTEGILMEEMRRRPSWGPNIPLDAEADVGQTYG